jgi:hypothetical protein
MPSKIYIFSEAGLWCGHNSNASVYDLEHDLDNLLQGAGEVIWEGMSIEAHVGMSIYSCRMMRISKFGFSGS